MRQFFFIYIYIKTPMAGSNTGGAAKQAAKKHAGKPAKAAKQPARAAKQPAEAAKQPAKAAKQPAKPERYTKTPQRDSNGRIVFRREGSSALFVRRKDKTGSFVFRRLPVQEGGGFGDQLTNFKKACQGLACSWRGNTGDVEEPVPVNNYESSYEGNEEDLEKIIDQILILMGKWEAIVDNDSELHDKRNLDIYSKIQAFKNALNGISSHNRSFLSANKEVMPKLLARNNLLDPIKIHQTEFIDYTTIQGQTEYTLPDNKNIIKLALIGYTDKPRFIKLTYGLGDIHNYDYDADILNITEISLDHNNPTSHHTYYNVIIQDQKEKPILNLKYEGEIGKWEP